jgi:CubicO group peptidase (beta-lactamase class C family)/predicted glycoside hydrolase/deacetylase ChbG (UPF0249 family)
VGNKFPDYISSKISSKMAYKKTTIALSFLYLLGFTGIHAQMSQTLARSTPEMEGVSSEAITQFLEAVGKSKNEFHSFMMLRHGKVIAEGWWNPYRPDLKHTLYSCSKSFTATAVGFAVAEKRMTVNDKVMSFFPNDLPTTISPNLADLSVKDLLSMSAGQFPEPSYIAGRDTNWAKAFLATPIVNKPGSKFLYNSLCTYMLSAIVQKVTGEKIIDYLTPRLFQPLGIEGMDWETDPLGINVGGWGLRLKTEDLAKFGQLFLQKGIWNGKQVLPAAWVEEASTLKIIQNPDLAQEKKDASDWQQGYCYQMWRCRNNAFRADGAFGQYIIMMPDQDAVIAITSETGDMQDELNLVWKHMLPAFQKDKLADDRTKATVLKQKLTTLALIPPAKAKISPIAAAISGKTFSLSPNTQYIQNMAFQFKGDVCEVSLKNNVDNYKLSFGAGQWIQGETAKLGPSLVGGAKNHFVGLPSSKVAGSYTWKSDSTLELVLRYIDSPHSETYTCNFDKNNMTADYKMSFSPKKEVLKGIATQGTQKPIQLIIRGDDMGFSHSANEALIKTFKQGIETSIEIIVPSPWFPEAVKFLAENPTVDVGIHLALSSEWDNVKWRPMTDCPSLKDKDGYFYPMIFPNKNYPNQSLSENKWKIEEIEKEFRAQIDMALKYVPRISHISAHMGCTDVAKGVKEMTKKLAKEYKIDIDLEDFGVKGMGFIGAKATAQDKIQSFINGLKTLEVGKSYLFVEHPAFDNAETQAIHHIGYENVAADRQGVTELFMSEEVKAFILKNGIKLVSYKDLGQQNK